jgi:DegV family protein with EDD domain
MAASSAPRVAVVTDSTADFTDGAAQELGIRVVPLTVNWGRDVLRDKIDVTTEEFYDRLRADPQLPKTAAPPIGIFDNEYRGLLRDHDAVISVHISSALSATFSVAEAAARQIDPDRICVVDSRTVSVGVGWLAIAAAERAAAGESAGDIQRALADMVPRIRLHLTLDTLEYLARGGRIGRARAFLGGLLNIKPILEVRDGEVHPVERVRSRAAAIRRVAEIAHQLGPKEQIAVVHGDSPDDARLLTMEFARLEGLGGVPSAQIGSVLGTHAGPGVAGIGSILAS